MINRYLNPVILMFVFSVSLVPRAQAVSTEAYQSYVRGLIASRTGDLSFALKEYERVVRMDREAVSVYKDLALVYWQLGETDKSLAAAEKLDINSREHVDDQLFLGSFYLMAGQSDRARLAWERVTAIDPDNETALLYLAAYNLGSDPAKAAAYWEEFVKRDPQSAEGYFQMGAAYEKLGDVESARRSYQKVIALRPESIESHLVLAQLYEKEEKFVAAAQEYERSIQIDPQNKSILLYLGGLYYRLKNFTAAEDVFRKALAVDPKDRDIHFWRGILAENRKDWVIAARSFEAVRAVDENTGVLLRLSYYYSMLRQHDNAVRCLKKVEALEPQNPTAHYLLGLAYFEQKKFRPAEKKFLAATELKPDFEDAFFNLAVMYDQWKKFPQAENALKKVLEINADHAAALNYLGYSYADHNINIDEAERLVRRALEIDPFNGAYLDSLGWVYYRKGMFVEAEKELAAASAKLPDPVIWEHLGDTRIKMGNVADAWDAYQKALSLDPENRRIKGKINQVKRQVLPKTLQRKVLKRAEGNLMQIRSLKANISLAGSLAVFTTRSFGVFKYRRPDNWRLDVLGSFMAPQLVIIENEGITVYPRALNAEIAPIGRLVLERIKQYLNSSLLAEFDKESVRTEVSGDLFYFHDGDKSILIDSADGSLRQYKIDKQIILCFRDHTLTEGLYIPGEIEILMPKENIHVRVKLQNVVLNEDMDDDTFLIN